MHTIVLLIISTLLGQSLLAADACTQAQQKTRALFEQLKKEDTIYQQAVAQHDADFQSLESSPLKQEWRKNNKKFFDEIVHYPPLATVGLTTYYRFFFEIDFSTLSPAEQQAKLASTSDGLSPALTRDKYDELLALYNKIFKGDYAKKADATAQTLKDAEAAMVQRVYQNPAYVAAQQQEKDACKR